MSDETEARKQLALDAEPLREELCHQIAVCVARHLTVLVSKRRKARHEDDYGRVLMGRWWDDIVYFVEHVLFPELEASPDYEQSLATIHLDWVCNQHLYPEVDEYLAGEGATITGYYSRFLLHRIDALVAAGEEMEPPHQSVEEMSPLEFEKYCADELRSAGWEVRISAGPGDQGVDLVARRDGVVAVFQCKLYERPLGNTPVQEVHTGRAFFDAGLAAVVGRSGYTSGAKAAAAQTGVLLLDHSDLAKLRL